MKRKEYSEAFKLRVVGAVVIKPKSNFDAVAKKFAVSSSSVRRWVEKYGDNIAAKKPTSSGRKQAKIGKNPRNEHASTSKPDIIRQAVEEIVEPNQYSTSFEQSEETEESEESEESEEIQDTLAEALEKCKVAAEDGYRKARDTFAAIDHRIKKIRTNISSSLKDFQKYNLRSEDLAGRIIQQLKLFSNAISEVPSKFENALKEKHLNLQQFSVTLFGRTMAGKSTLMEILTRGNGSSIGSGAQRTTRDVRTYRWNGLAITDVPGIAAFKGTEDEEIAYQAASIADMVLFLITDDAPQNSEAECVARIMSIGKPVLGICNVKKAVDDPIDLKIFLKRHEDVFSKIRLNEIFEQFHELTNQYLPDNRIEFIPCHLRSYFLARQKEIIPEKRRLKEVSRFADVEKRIVEVIKSNGLFWRFKSFNDAVCFRLSEFTDRILKERYEVKSLQLTIADKRSQYNDWQTDFEEKAINQIMAFVSSQKERFDRLIPNFSEENYSDKNVNERWQSHVKRLDIPFAARQFQEKLHEKCVSGIREFAREVDAEMRCVENLINAEQIQGREIVDYKKIVNWVGGIISGALSIGAIFFSGPLGWGAGVATAATAFVSWLCESKEDKIKRARRELEQKLYESSTLIIKDMKTKLVEWFREDLLRLMSRFASNLESAEGCFNELIDVQGQTISEFLSWQKNLNREVLRQGLGTDYQHLWSGAIKDVARIPGVATMLVVRNNAGIYIDKVAIEQKIGEKVYSLVDGDKKSLVAQAFGSEQVYSKLTIDEKSFVIKVCPTTKDGELLARLSQQLTGLYLSLIK